MANLVNINAEQGANFIGDDAQPALTITNSSTGAGLESNRVVVTSAATVAQLNVAGGTLAANATIIGASLQGASRASGAVLSFRGDGLTSAVSIVFAASANWAGLRVMRVVLENGEFGWVPVLPNAVVTAAAVA